jgi:putative colanic acid biosynthesis UDP-glucose lipid carrier transferase
VTRTHLAARLESLIAAVLLVSLLPVLAIIAVLIMCESRGPILVRRRALGSHGESIELALFRTTPPGDQYGGKVFTRVGRFLHRTGLERLPCLWNVLLGEIRLLDATRTCQAP